MFDTEHTEHTEEKQSLEERRSLDLEPAYASNAPDLRARSGHP